MAIEARKVRDEAQKYVDNRDFKDLTLEGQKNVITQYRLRFIQAIEKEKLFYFMLASFNPQPVLVVLAPETKDDEKKYLGYEWSTRKGTEGIHYLNTGKIQDAGQDDEDAEQNPHLKGRRDRMEGSIEQRRDDRHDGGQYTGDYGEQNQLRPGQINPAEQFLNQFFHVQSISF